MDCSPPGSSVHGISQARILEWVAIPLSKGSSQPGDQKHVSCTAGRFFTTVYICQSQSPNSTVWFLSNSLYGTGYACWYKPQKMDENNTLNTVISGQWDYE